MYFTNSTQNGIPFSTASLHAQLPCITWYGAEMHQKRVFWESLKFLGLHLRIFAS